MQVGEPPGEVKEPGEQGEKAEPEGEGGRKDDTRFGRVRRGEEESLPGGWGQEKYKPGEGCLGQVEVLVGVELLQWVEAGEVRERWSQEVKPYGRSGI